MDRILFCSLGFLLGTVGGEPLGSSGWRISKNVGLDVEASPVLTVNSGSHPDQEAGEGRAGKGQNFKRKSNHSVVIICQ